LHNNGYSSLLRNFLPKIPAALLSFGYSGKNPADFSATNHSPNVVQQLRKKMSTEKVSELTRQNWKDYNTVESIKKVTVALTELTINLELPITIKAEFDFEHKNFKTLANVCSIIDKDLQQS
jgi:hypothetical protein